MKLEQIDLVALQPLQAGVQRGGDRGADPARLGRRQPHLGADIDIGLQRFQHAAEIASRDLAVAVHARRIEIVDAELERARHRALLVGRRRP